MSSGEFSVAKLRELVAGDLEHENDHLHPHTGLVGDADLGELLSFCEAHADELTEPLEADRVADTEFGRQLIAKAATERATGAVDAAGPGARASFFSGVTDVEVSVSAAQVLVRLLGIVRPAGRLIVWTGGTNHGKTNTALLMMELLAEDRPDTAFASNMRSIGGLEYEIVESSSELSAFLEATDGESFIWLDEASSHMTGYSGDRHDVEEHMRPVVRACAKHHARLAYGAHRVTDAHPTIRDMPNCRFIENERLEDTAGTALEYVARVYTDLGPDGEPAGEEMLLRELPETSLTYDPDERTTWSWD